MKSTFGLYRIFWLANSVLLVIFGYLVVSILLAREPRQQAPANLKYETAEADTNQDEDSSDPENTKIILSRNIFGPAGANTVEKDSKNSKPIPPSQQTTVKKPLELRLLGTVAGDEQIACAVIEDMKTKVQDLYRTGDNIQESRIAKIERNRVILLRGGVQEVLNLYVASEASVASNNNEGSRVAEKPRFADAIKVISPSDHAINKSSFLAKIGGMEAVLKTVKVSPYVKNGQEEGLRITGLEGLSMARYVGLENGDIIQMINGQKVTNERKAFQVLRKARTLSSSDIQLLRGKEKKTLSFRIE